MEVRTYFSLCRSRKDQNEDVTEAAVKNRGNSSETGCSKLVSSEEKGGPGDISEIRP